METVLLMSSIVLWLVVLGNLVLTFALIRRVNAGDGRAGQELPSMGLEAGTEAPDFTAQMLGGEQVTRATYLGRSVAFVFISTHCQPCREILPEIGNLEPGAARAGVDIVLVSKDTQEATSAFVDEMQIHLPVLIAPFDSNPFMKEYKATVTPLYCLVDEQGKVQSAGLPQGGEWKALAESWSRQGLSLPAKRR